MKSLSILLLFIIVLISSCDKEEASKQQNDNDLTIENEVLEIAAPKNLKPTIRLTSPASKGVENWSFYSNLTIAVDSLQATSLTHLKSNLKRFDVLYLTQEEAEEAEVPLTPEVVKTKAIQARLVAIETKAKILNSHAYLNTPDTLQIANQIGDVYNAYQDLNLQLNELFDTSFKDLLEEIKQENIEAANQTPEE